MKYEETMHRCPECGEMVRRTSNFCPHCGKQIPKEAPTVCSKCGAKLEPGAKFCAYCATPVSADSPVEPNYYPPRTDPFGGRTFPVESFTWWPKSARIEDLCGSVACLVLTVAFTVQLVCKVLFHFSISNLIGNIPMILICIGCWMCFAGGRQNTLTPSGFGLISGTLTFLGVVACVASAFGCLLGVVLIAAAEETRGIGFVVLLICAACIYFIWKYWNQLRQAAKSAAAVVQNGCGRIPASMYSIVLLYIGAASELISLVNMSSTQSAINDLYNYVYWLNLPYEVERAVYAVLDKIAGQGTSFTAVLSSLAAVIVPLCAGLILQRIRKEQKTWVS